MSQKSKFWKNFVGKKNFFLRFFLRLNFVSDYIPQLYFVCNHLIILFSGLIKKLGLYHWHPPYHLNFLTIITTVGSMSTYCELLVHCIIFNLLGPTLNVCVSDDLPSLSVNIIVQLLEKQWKRNGIA